MKLVLKGPTNPSHGLAAQTCHVVRLSACVSGHTTA